MEMNFYKQLSEYYDVIFPLNEQSINFIMEHSKKGALLDVGAGTGNHAIAFAELGHNVTATDLDKDMLEKISEKARGQNLDIEVMLLPMEQLNDLSGRAFTTIICLGNSLVHLKNENEVIKTLENMYDLLEDKGTLVLQIVNYDHVLREGITQLPFISRDNGHITFKRTYKIEKGIIKFHGLITVGDEEYENEIPLLPITSDFIEETLNNIGFSTIRKFGSFKGEAYKLDSPALIVVATK